MDSGRDHLARQSGAGSGAQELKILTEAFELGATVSPSPTATELAVATSIPGRGWRNAAASFPERAAKSAVCPGPHRDCTALALTDVANAARMRCSAHLCRSAVRRAYAPGGDEIAAAHVAAAEHCGHTDYA